jgi:hypothetical protein
MAIRTNDIKKGWRIQQHNGWYGTMMDNRKGNLRMVNVEGDFTETGDIYAHEIYSACDPATGVWHTVEYTPSQLELRARVHAFFY